MATKTVVLSDFDVTTVETDSDDVVFYSDDEYTVATQISGRTLELITVIGRAMVESGTPGIGLIIFIPVRAAKDGSTILNDRGHIYALPCPPYCSDDTSPDVTMKHELLPLLDELEKRLPTKFRRRIKKS